MDEEVLKLREAIKKLDTGSFRQLMAGVAWDRHYLNVMFDFEEHVAVGFPVNRLTITPGVKGYSATTYGNSHYHDWPDGTKPR